MSSKTIFRQSTDVISIPSGDYTVEELEAYIRLGKLAIMEDD